MAAENTNSRLFYFLYIGFFASYGQNMSCFKAERCEWGMAGQIDLEFLRQEYFQLQQTVEDFDKRNLTIKTWSVTVSMAAVGAAITQKAPILLVLASGSALLFWIIEALWKSFQLAYYHRIRTIESYMRGGGPEDFTVPDINRAWSTGWRQYSMKTIIWWPHVFLPHAIIVVFGLGAWVANWFVKIVPL